MTVNDLIKKYQQALVLEGSKIQVDGSYGPITTTESEMYDIQITAHRKEIQSAGHDLTPAFTIIKEFEGFNGHAYLDPVGVPTIGWGTTVYPNGMKVKMGDGCTIEEAEAFLTHDVQSAVDMVENLVLPVISNNAFCALVSFCYNVGGSNLAGSTMLKLLNAGSKMEVVAEEFDKWVYGGAVILPGLVRRRADEKALFLA